MVFIPVSWLPYLLCIGGIAAAIAGTGGERAIGVVAAIAGGVWAAAWLEDTDKPSQ